MEKDNFDNPIEGSDIDYEKNDPRVNRPRPEDPRDDPLDGKNPRFGENSPDEILERDRPEGEEYEEQILHEKAGENLETQNPTGEQTSGEDDVGGFSDEDYDEKEGEDY